MSDSLSRRGFLQGAAAVGVAGVAAGPAWASRASIGRPGHGLPRRTEFVIRNAYVMTMDKRLGDLPRADVHVRGGKIAAVGRRLRAGGREIDGRDTIVMPGLVDTHWHMWTTLYRSLAGAGSDPANGYFALNVRNGSVMRPDDIYQGARLSLADAAFSGITTVHDWSHNIRGPAFADANLRAHAESGLRGRFSYGTPQGTPPTQTIDLEDFQRVNREWFRSGRLPLMRLGLAGRPPGLVGPEVYRPEYEKARELGLPVSYHANSNPQQGAQQMIRLLSEQGMLGPDTQLIHALYTTDQELKAVVDTRTPVTTSPWSELLIGYGLTPISRMAKAGVRLTLSVDTTPLTGTAELFSVMRLTTGLARGEALDEFDLSARRVLEMATIDGASSLGLGELTGSLEPGKRADLIMVRTDDVNIAPVSDAPNAIALAAAAHNVDTVVADGRILKRDGRLTAVNTDRVVRESRESLRWVLERAAAPPKGKAAAAAAATLTCCG